MKRLTLFLALGASVALMPLVSKANIIGSNHDFSATSPDGAAVASAGYAVYSAGGGGTYSNPCQICHIPHNAPDASSTTGSGGPIWNHHPSVNSSYVTYDKGNSTTFNGLGLTATLGSSFACLSCHDGSMAVNQSYSAAYPSANGVTGTSSAPVAAYYVPTWAVVTAAATTGSWASPTGAGPYLGRNDLTHMHPIGISYPAALAVDKTLQPLPATGTVFAQMLKGPNQTVECASCHDIHKVIGQSNNATHDLIIDVNNAALCQNCHQQ